MKKNLAISLGVFTCLILLSGIVWFNIDKQIKDKDSVIPILSNAKNTIIFTSKINSNNVYVLFDTGAELCVIDSSKAYDLDAYQIPLIKARVNNNKKYPLCLLSKLEIKGMVFKNVIAVAIPFPKELGCSYDFILGMSIISKINCNISFDENNITFTNNLIDKTPNSISYEYNDKLRPIIPIQVNGKQYEVLVDAGFTGTCEINDLNSINLNDSDLYQNKGLVAVKIDKNINEEVYQRIGDIILNRDTIQNQLICYHNEKTKVGIGFLTNYSRFIINGQNKQIIFSEKNNKELSSKLKGFGFSLGVNEDKVFIANIFQNSPVSEIGICLKDTVVIINGKKIEDLLTGDYCSDNETISKFMSNDTIDLVVLKEGKHKSLRLISQYF